MKTLGLLLASPTLILAISACGGGEATAPESNDSSTSAPSSAADTSASPSRSSSSTSGKTEAKSGFLKANAGAPWADRVTSVDEGEQGRLTIETSIVDPRGEDGSPAARTALKVCRAAVSYLKDDGTAEPYVAVREDDGTTFAVASPAVDGGGCSEY